MELIATSAIWVSASIILINMLSDMFGILPISISKAAILFFSTSVAEAYLVIKNYSISAFISTDRSLVLSNSSSSRLRSSGTSTMLCLHMFKPIPFPRAQRASWCRLRGSNWVRFAKNGAFVPLMSHLLLLHRKFGSWQSCDNLLSALFLRDSAAKTSEASLWLETPGLTWRSRSAAVHPSRGHLPDRRNTVLRSF